MAVSGLVVTLAACEGACAAAREALASDPRLTLGECFGRRVSVVAQTGSPREDRDLWESLRAMPGVEHVDVAFVGFDGDTQGAGEASHDER